MKNPKAVLVIGSSGTGKTTTVNGLRSPEFSDKVIVPKRYITRPLRENDDLVENAHIDFANFRERALTGQISPYWMRALDNDRVEHYGFDAVAKDDNRLPIYSANNAFLRDINDTTGPLIENGLVVVLKADPTAKVGRLATRSPDMTDSERAVRLGDNGSQFAIRNFNRIDIDTTELSDAAGQLALQEVVGDILAGR